VLDQAVANLRRLLLLCDELELEELQVGRSSPVGSELGIPVFCLPTEMLVRPEPDAPRKLGTVLATTLAAINLGSGRRGVWLASCLSHSNLIAAGAGLQTTDYAFGRDIYLSQIPMSCAFERSMQLIVLANGGCVSFCDEKLLQALVSIRPTVIALQTAALRDLALAISERTGQAGVVKRRMLEFAFDLAAQVIEDGRAPPWIMRLGIAAAVNSIVGGRLRLAISYGWNLDARVQSTLRTMLQVPVIQVYGTTECGGVVCVQQIGDTRNECVGGPAICCEIQLKEFWQSGMRLAEGQPGEVLVRGPNVFKGYHRTRRRTMDAMLDGGWFRTGDLGRIMPDGSLKIEDRVLSWTHRTH
jgi:long-chain acyl-CoA synthetase